MDQQRAVFLECLCRKGIALCRLYLLEEKNEEVLENISKLWKTLAKFVDPTDSKVTIV